MNSVTIGMAHHEDFSGAYFSIQHARMLLGSAADEVEFVVVDQSPNTRSSEMLRGFLNVLPNARYVAYTDVLGTSASRNRVFTEASGDVVCCMDCHVLLNKYTLDRLRSGSFGRDLWQGPILFDDFRSGATHFDAVWRAEMFGIWGQAWSCDCLNFQFGLHKSANGQAAGHTITMNSEPCSSCPACGKRLPSVPWEGHEVAFAAADYLRLGFSDLPETFLAFEIPGQGLGMFICRKDAWLGFNEHAVGFGGEELYIHEKFRLAGNKALCDPRMLWGHRFGREMGVRYPLTRFNKVRNYVLEFEELGWDKTPIREHFVDAGLMSATEWQSLVEEPTKKPQGCGTCGGGAVFDSSNTLKAQQPETTNVTSLSQAFQIVRNQPRDLDQHMESLRALASEVEVVAELSGRAESTMAFLAAEPAHLISVNSERNPLVERAAELFAKDTKYFKTDVIDACDLLFLDTVHDKMGVLDQLTEYGKLVKRYIVLHDTQIFPEVLEAAREFMKANSEWSVISHTVTQYGLTVLGCQDNDKPELPGVVKMAANFTKALASHTVDGLKTVEPKELSTRLKACTVCDQRNNGRCAACGCVIETKAKWRTSECPLGRWPNDDSPS